MEHPVPRPDTIHAFRWGADAAFAMLAGLQLDVFTPLQGGPLTTAQLAEAVGVGPARLRLLLYALVAAGLLTEQDGRFANTPEAQHFLVQGTPTSLGPLHRHLAAQWAFKLHTAASIRTGVPQVHLDFAQAVPEVVEAFLRRINVSTGAAGQELGARYDFTATRTLVDVGGGAGCLSWPGIAIIVQPWRPVPSRRLGSYVPEKPLHLRHSGRPLFGQPARGAFV